MPGPPEIKPMVMSSYPRRWLSRVRRIISSRGVKEGCDAHKSIAHLLQIWSRSACRWFAPDRPITCGAVLTMLHPTLPCSSHTIQFKGCESSVSSKAHVERTTASIPSTRILPPTARRYSLMSSSKTLERVQTRYRVSQLMALFPSQTRLWLQRTRVSTLVILS